jgi:hypothetical protein
MGKEGLQNALITQKRAGKLPVLSQKSAGSLRGKLRKKGVKLHIQGFPGEKHTKFPVLTTGFLPAR